MTPERGMEKLDAGLKDEQDAIAKLQGHGRGEQKSQQRSQEVFSASRRSNAETRRRARLSREEHLPIDGSHGPALALAHGKPSRISNGQPCTVPTSAGKTPRRIVSN